MQTLDILKRIVELEDEDIDCAAIEARMTERLANPRPIRSDDQILGPIPPLARKLQAIGWELFEECEEKYGKCVSRNSPTFTSSALANDNLKLIGDIMWAVIRDVYQTCGTSLAMVEGFLIVIEKPSDPLRELFDKMNAMGLA